MTFRRSHACLKALFCRRILCLTAHPPVATVRILSQPQVATVRILSSCNAHRRNAGRMLASFSEGSALTVQSAELHVSVLTFLLTTRFPPPFARATPPLVPTLFLLLTCSVALSISLRSRAVPRFFRQRRVFSFSLAKFQSRPQVAAKRLLSC
jgi:hypothetical protein